MTTPRSLTGTVLQGRGLLVPFVFIGALCAYWVLLGLFGPGKGAVAILVLLAFVGTVFVIEIGVVTLVAGMLFSPELPLGRVSVRTVTLRLEDVLILAVLVAWFARTSFVKSDRRLIPCNLYIPLLLFTVVSVYSTLRGGASALVDTSSGLMYILKTTEFFLIFVFVFNYLVSFKHIRKVLIVMVAMATILSLMNLHKVPGTEVWTENRISMPFEGGTPEPSTYGGYFILILGLLIAFFYHAPNGRVRLWFGILFGIMFVPFLFTLSRTSYVAFLAMLVGLVVFTRNVRLLFALVALLAVSPLVLPRRVLDRVEYTFTDRVKTFGVFDRSTGERLNIWKKARWNLAQRPLFGGGITKDQVIDSYYARILIETGIVGFALFVLIVVSIFRTAWRLHGIAVQWWVRGVVLGYLIAFLGLLFHALSAITFYIVRIAEPFWFFTGIVYAAAYLTSASPPAPTGNPSAGGDPVVGDPGPV